MNQKLPGVFANKINKKIKNNNEIYMTTKETQNKEEKNNEKMKFNEKTIEQKINEIIKSNKYIYKIPVMIKLNDKVVETNIIGKNKTNIITINNELIKIEDIKDIEIKEHKE